MFLCLNLLISVSLSAFNNCSDDEAIYMLTASPGIILVYRKARLSAFNMQAFRFFISCPKYVKDPGRQKAIMPSGLSLLSSREKHSFVNSLFALKLDWSPRPMNITSYLNGVVLMKAFPSMYSILTLVSDSSFRVSSTGNSSTAVKINGSSST